MRKRTRQKSNKKKKKKATNLHLVIRCFVFSAAIVASFSFLFFILYFVGAVTPKQVQTVVESISPVKKKITVNAPDFQVDLLTVNPYSRPGDKLEKVNGIVIHYTANPGTTAAQNRSYFESLKDTHETSSSAHFVVGIEGEIIQCIPTSEISYASNDRNVDTISIECCHKNKDGKFTQETYDSLVHLTAFLMTKYDLTTSQVIRHYDVTGKLCPLYYVKHEDKWKQFKKDVDNYVKYNGLEETVVDDSAGNNFTITDTSN